MLLVYTMVMIYDKIVPTDLRGLVSLEFDVKVMNWKWFFGSFVLWYILFNV